MSIIAVLIGVARLLRAVAIPALLVASLLLNVLIFTSSAVFNMAASVVGGLTAGRTVIASRTRELAETSAALTAERATNRELREEVTRQSAELLTERQITRESRSALVEVSSDLASHKTALAAERQVIREVRGQLAETTSALAANAAVLSAERGAVREARSQLVGATGELENIRLARKQLQKATSEIAERISVRSAKSAARELAAMPAESIPVWGTAIIVGATALELADLCQTLVDMTELRRALDPTATQSSEELTVCALEVPSRSEIWKMASDAPEKVWMTALSALPDVSDLHALDPRTFNWPDVARNMIGNGKGLTRDVGDWMSEKGGQLETWWKN